MLTPLRVQVSLSKCPFRVKQFYVYQGVPQNFPLHPPEHDTCAVTPCTAMQGQTSVVFLKSPSEPPCGQWKSFSFVQRGPAKK